MSLIKYLTQKEFHNPVIDGVIGGFGDGVGELLYDYMWWHSYRWPTKKWEDLNPTIVKALNQLDGRAYQLRDYYYSSDSERLNCYWGVEDFFRGLTKLLFGPAFFLIGEWKRVHKNRD